jgi:branched-chain amino acid transport system substrate-binding protein
MRTTSISRRRFLKASSAGLIALSLPPRAFGNATPALVGVDAEFFQQTSTSDDAIQLGAQTAIDDINALGGVLGGRPLQLITTDNRGVPARGIANVERLGSMPNMTAYLAGKFSPVVLEQLPHIHDVQLPLLAPWSAADAIVDNHREPNYAFRLGLRDSIAMEALLEAIRARGLHKVGLIAPSTAWGRSCQFFIERFLTQKAGRSLELSGVEWHRWGSDRHIDEGYRALVDHGADAIVLVANEPEGSALVKAVAQMPQSSRRPIFSHWGITGGRFTELCGPALHHVELEVAQSFSFAGVKSPEGIRLAQRATAHFGVDDPLKVPSATGIGPAYDLVRLLAVAIEQAGSTKRAAIHEALEHLPPYSGVVGRFAPAFTPSRHEALGARDVLTCRFDTDGRLIPRNVRG